MPIDQLPSDPAPPCQPRRTLRRASCATRDLVALGAEQEKHPASILSSVVPPSSLAKISQGLASARRSQTIAAPGRSLPAHSFEHAASLFDAPHKPANQDNMCSICLERIDPRGCRELGCGHWFHSHCIAKYSCSQPATCVMPCPDCRQPFHAFHDSDHAGHAQARELLSHPQTAAHLGLRHCRPVDPAPAPQPLLADKDLESSKRGREPNILVAMDTDEPVTKRPTHISTISGLLQEISTDLAELQIQSDQQAVNVLRSASLGEILATLPQQPAGEVQLGRQSRLRRKQGRLKRRKERQRLLQFENAVTQLESEQQQLHQHWVTLNNRNECLRTQLAAQQKHPEQQ